MSKLKIDQTTGEVLPVEIMIDADKAPAVVLDVSEVEAYHNDPKSLADKIRQQAGFMVFDIGTQKGRDACRAHAANIIRCIAPAAKASQALAETAKQVVKQDLHFRKVFDEEIRAIAAFHRKPLTEYEEAVELQKEADRLAEEARLAEEKYLSDWQQAIDYDELFTLRREKERREEEDRNRAIAEDIANKKAWAKENADGYQFLFADIAQLVTKPMEEFQSVILSRLELHKKTEAEREERIHREAEEKANREAAQREEQIKREAAAKERERITAEQETQRAAQKSEQERVVDTTDSWKQNIVHKVQDVQTVEVQPITEPGKQFRTDAAGKIISTSETYIPPSKQFEAAEVKQSPLVPITFHDKAVNIIAKYYEIDYDTAKQWLIETFS